MRFINVVLCLNLGSILAVPHTGGLVSTGHSAQYRQEDNYGNYEFGYNEDHSEGGTFRKEKGSPHGVVGSYGLRDRDGRLRIVHYIADKDGFRVMIDTNEPGVDKNQNPASVLFTNGHQMTSHAYAHAEPAHHVEPVVAHQPAYIQPAYVEPAHHVDPAIHHKPSYMTKHVEPVVLHRPSYMSSHESSGQHSSALALAHSLSSPVIASPPISHHATNSNYEPEHHQGPTFQAVLAPLMHDNIDHHTAVKTHALVNAKMPAHSYSHLQYVPEDELHMNAYDGDFGKRFTPLKA